MLGQIFTKAQNKIQDPAKLSRLIDMVDETSWVMLGADVKGDIYEGLLEKNAEDTKSGAGQYFTPRAADPGMVECVRPEPGKTIADPACGTGGFFLAAYDFLVDNYPDWTRSRRPSSSTKPSVGNEIVAGTRRLCLMNMFLHNIGEIDGDSLISPNDALVARQRQTLRLRAGQSALRQEEQHELHQRGRRAGDGRPDLQPPGLLGDDLEQAAQLRAAHPHHAEDHRPRRRGRAGQRAVRRRGGRDGPQEAAGNHRPAHHPAPADRHLLRQRREGERALLRQPARPARTRGPGRSGIYDYRTNIHHTLKKKPLRFEDLADFIACYNPLNRHERKETWDAENNPEGRWRKFSYEQIVARDKTSLDIFWLKDKSLADLDNLPEPDELAGEIIENLEAGLNSFQDCCCRFGLGGLVKSEAFIEEFVRPAGPFRRKIDFNAGPGRRSANTHRRRPRRLRAVRRQKGRRRDRGQAEEEGQNITTLETKPKATPRPSSNGSITSEPLALPLRKHRHHHPLHRRPRPQAPLARGLQLPPPGNPPRLAGAGEQPARPPAATCRRSTRIIPPANAPARLPGNRHHQSGSLVQGGPARAP